MVEISMTVNRTELFVPEKVLEAVDLMLHPFHETRDGVVFLYGVSSQQKIADIPYPEQSVVAQMVELHAQ